MKTSTERILTTHVGSLPRPQEVVDFIFAEDRGESFDRQKYDSVLRRAVADVCAGAAAAIVTTGSGRLSGVS